MILSITEASKRTGIGRSTLYAMRKKGTISFTKNEEEILGIDLSELMRVFPTKTSHETPAQTPKDSHETNTSGNILAIEKAYLEEKVRFLENQLVLEQDRVRSLLEINKNHSAQLLLTHQDATSKSLWKRIMG